MPAPPPMTYFSTFTVEKKASICWKIRMWIRSHERLRLRLRTWTHLPFTQGRQIWGASLRLKRNWSIQLLGLLRLLQHPLCFQLLKLAESKDSFSFNCLNVTLVDKTARLLQGLELSTTPKTLRISGCYILVFLQRYKDWVFLLRSRILIGRPFELRDFNQDFLCQIEGSNQESSSN